MVTPASYAKDSSEHSHQVSVCMHFAIERANGRYLETELMFAVPNGGDRDKAVAGRLKAEGVKPGVPDLMLPVARKGFHGLFVEMKIPKYRGTQKGGLSDAQFELHPKLIAQGYWVQTCYHWEEAVSVISSYLTGD